MLAQQLGSTPVELLTPDEETTTEDPGSGGTRQAYAKQCVQRAEVS